MALRLRPTRNTAPIQEGFTLVINQAEGTYDLDELLETVDRQNENAPLILQVIDDEGVRERLEETYSQLGEKIAQIIGSALNEETVKNEINNIVSSSLESYGYAISSEEDLNTRYFLEVIAKDISAKIAKYINSLDIIDEEDGEPLQGKIITRLSFLIDENNKINVKVEYDVDNKVKSDKLFDIYQRTYENNSDVQNVQVGGLAVDAHKSTKVKITNEDYQKYLLSEEKSTEGYTEPGLRRPLIIWTDASEDPNINTGDSLSLLDQIDYLKKIIKEMSEKDKYEELPEPPSEVGEYLLQLKVTSKGSEKSWIRKEDIGRSGIIIEENLDGTYTAFIGNTSLETLTNGTMNLVLPWLTPTFLDNATYAYIG